MKKITFSILFVLAASLTFAVETIPFEIVNNSQFSDSEVYIGLVGRRDGAAVWFDFAASGQNNPVTHPIEASYNTIHKTAGDRGYANIFTPLDKVATGKTIYFPKLSACRIFIAFRKPMYIHFFDGGGYAGADLQNPVDPNYGIRWELIEFTWANNGLWVNTSRVDAFQYPMGVELWGAADANVPYAKAGELLSYAQLINKWNSQLGSDKDFAACYSNNITSDNLGGIIEQPSKIASFKEGGASADYYKSYIDQIWSAFSGKELVCDQGERGVWRGRISGNVLTMTGELGSFNGVQARISGKPTTQEIIEGKGIMAQGSEQDKALQAQFCGAIARGAIDVNVASGVQQNWGDAASYYKKNTYNKYAAFFHQTDVSYGGKCYGFSYDDTFDQSSTLVTDKPTKVKVTIGGFTSNPGGKVEPTETDPPTPIDPPTPSGDEKATGTGSTSQGLDYSYTCTYKNGKLTVTIKCTNPSSFTGLVPVIYCDSKVGTEDYEYVCPTCGAEITKSYDANIGDTFKFRGKWMFAGGDSFTPSIEYKITGETGVQETKSAFALYPNPTAGYLYIDGVADTNFVVYDLFGKLILSGNALPVDVTSLKEGLYIITVDGHSRKFVKK